MEEVTLLDKLPTEVVQLLCGQHLSANALLAFQQSCHAALAVGRSAAVWRMQCQQLFLENWRVGRCQWSSVANDHQSPPLNPGACSWIATYKALRGTLEAYSAKPRAGSHQVGHAYWRCRAIGIDVSRRDCILVRYRTDAASCWLEDEWVDEWCTADRLRRRLMREETRHTGIFADVDEGEVLEALWFRGGHPTAMRVGIVDRIDWIGKSSIGDYEPAQRDITQMKVHLRYCNGVPEAATDPDEPTDDEREWIAMTSFRLRLPGAMTRHMVGVFAPSK